MRKFRVILKNGCDFIIECEQLKVSRDLMGQVVSLDAKNIKGFFSIFDLTEVCAIAEIIE